MRSTKITIGIACGATLVALMVTALATTGAGAAGPVGSGTASATKSVCGMGTGKKATGTPIKLGGIDMLIPGVDFTTIGKVAAAYFKCVNDNGGINGHPIQLHALQRAAQPGAAGRAREEAGRERQGRRHRRQHELHRVRHQLEVLQVQGLRRDRRRRPGRVLRHAGLRRVEHGAALQQHRRRAGARPGRREVARSIASPDTIAAYADGGVAQGRTGGRHPRSRASRRSLPITDANSTILQAGAGCRARRRRDPRLHARHGTAADEGGRSPRASSTR